MSTKSADIGGTNHLVEHHDRIVCHEKYHRVLTNISKHWNARDIDIEQYARKSTEGECDTDDCDDRIAHPDVIDHSV